MIINPTYDEMGNLEIPLKVWKKLGWWEKFKLMLIGACIGKFVVMKKEVSDGKKTRKAIK